METIWWRTPVPAAESFVGSDAFRQVRQQRVPRPEPRHPVRPHGRRRQQPTPTAARGATAAAARAVGWAGFGFGVAEVGAGDGGVAAVDAHAPQAAAAGRVRLEQGCPTLAVARCKAHPPDVQQTTIRPDLPALKGSTNMTFQHNRQAHSFPNKSKLQARERERKQEHSRERERSRAQCGGAVGQQRERNPHRWWVVGRRHRLRWLEAASASRPARCRAVPCAP